MAVQSNARASVLRLAPPFHCDNNNRTLSCRPKKKRAGVHLEVQISVVDQFLAREILAPFGLEESAVLEGGIWFGLAGSHRHGGKRTRVKNSKDNARDAAGAPLLAAEGRGGSPCS